MASRLFVFLVALFSLTTANAGDEHLVSGGDTFASGFRVSVEEPAEKDVLASGFSVDIDAPTKGDVLSAGFNVDINAPVAQDLYAMGFSVDVNEPVGEDLAVSGINLHIGKNAGIEGNARLSGASIILDAPVKGSLTAAAGEMEINGTITGDTTLTVGTLTFGPDAKIEGKLSYRSAEPVDIPQSVIPAERVTFSKVDMPSPDIMHDAMEKQMPGEQDTFAGGFFSFIFAIAFLTALGAAFLNWLPGRSEAVRDQIIETPWRAMVAGIIGLAALIGLVPVSALTIIGLPLIPVILLVIIIVWVLAYVAGAYALAWRVNAAFRESPRDLTGKIIVLAAGFVALALVNYIPVVGWMINLAVVLAGIGVLTVMTLNRAGLTIPARANSVAT